METLHVPAQLIDPLSCNDGWSYIPVSFVFWQNTSRDSRSNRKPFICPGSQPQNCRVCAHNVSWKVNVWTLLRAQSVSAGPSCLMRRRWSEAHLDTPPFPQQGQSWHSVISESTCFLLLALALCPASRKQTRRKKKKTLLNDGTKITSHTQTSTPATPAQHLLDLVVISSYFPANLLQKKEEKKLLSPAPPLILLIFFFFPPFLPFLLPLFIAAVRFPQSQTAAGGQGDVPLKPEEFTIGESTGERLIIYLSVQSAPSAHGVGLSFPHSFSPLHHVVSSLLTSLKSICSSCEWVAIFPCGIICYYSVSAQIPTAASVPDCDEQDLTSHTTIYSNCHLQKIKLYSAEAYRLINQQLSQI